jgi:hypothetical protein
MVENEYRRFIMCDFIGFTSYVNTGPVSKIAIDNQSEAGWSMISVTYDFTPQFELGGLTNQLSPGLYGLETIVTASGNQSFTGYSISGQSMTWTFSGMGSGEGTGWKLPIGGGIRGGEINGTTISAQFTNGSESREVEYQFSGVTGNGVSFYANASVPEPSGIALIGMLVGVLVARFRSR